MKILIIDNNNLEADIMIRKLKNDEVHWSSSYSYGKAILEIRKYYFDLILLDIVGTVYGSVAEAYKDLQDITKTTIVVMSGDVKPVEAKYDFVEKKYMYEFIDTFRSVGI